MKLKNILLSMGLLVTLTASAADASVGAAHGYLWLVITIIALAALVVSVVNAFRITTIKKMLEVNLQNQKEDMELSFKKIKSSLGRDIGNMRREVNKRNEGGQQNQKKPMPKKAANKNSNTTEDAEDGQGKTPVKKNVRKPQRRKYHPRKKQGGENSGEESKDKGTSE